MITSVMVQEVASFLLLCIVKIIVKIVYVNKSIICDARIEILTSPLWVIYDQ